MWISDDKTIEHRLSVCQQCPSTKDMSDNPLYFFVDMLGNVDETATKLMCTECSCPIYVKVRVPKNSCPLNKWET